MIARSARPGRRLAWLLWSVLVLLSLIEIARMPVHTDIGAFLPGPATPAQAVVDEQLRDGVGARLLLLAIESAEPTQLAPTSRALAARLRAVPMFDSVDNGDEGSLGVERDRLFAARYLLSPHIDEHAFTREGLSRMFARLEAALRGVAAPVLRPILREDPGLESLAILDSIGAGGGTAVASRDGVWVGGDGRRALLIVRTRAAGSDLDAQAQAIDRIRAEFAALDVAAASLRIGGAPALAVQSRLLISRDAQRLSLLAMVAIVALLWFALRSLRFVLVAALPIASGIVAGLACVGFVNGSIHAITLAFGVTLIGEAVDYSIYAYVQRADYREQPRRFWSLLWFAAGSSAAGFLMMVFSGFRGLEQLGMFSIVGIAVAATTTRFLLPALLPTAAPIPPRWLDRVLLGVQHGARRTRVVWLLAVVLAIAHLYLQRDRLWDDGLAAISPLPGSALQAEAALRADLGLPEAGLLVVALGNSLEQALRRAEAAEPALAHLRDAGRLAGYDSPSNILPSIARQRERQRAIPESAVLRERIRDALAGTTMRAQAFEPFVAALEAARLREPLTLDDYASGPLRRRLDAQIGPDRPAGRASVILTLYGADDPQAVRSAIAGIDEVHLIDLRRDVETIIGVYRGRALGAALIGLLAICGAIAWRSGRGGAPGVIAALPGTVLIASALISIIYTRLTLFNLIALLLVAGVASNYALFFAAQAPDGGARPLARLSVGLCALTTFTAFAALALSSTPVLRMIGSTVAIGVPLGLLMSMAFAAPPGADDA